VNRRLDYPSHIFVDNNGEIVFSDFFNLQKITLDPDNNNLHTVSSLAYTFTRHPMKFDAATNQVYVAERRDLHVYDYNDLAAGPTVIGTAATQYGYELGGTVSNDFQKLSYMSSSYDGVQGRVYRTYLYHSDFTTPAAVQSSLMTHTDLLSAAYNYCGPTGTDPCSAAITTSGAHDGSTFRLSALSGRYRWHSATHVSAYDTANQNVYTCLNNSFAKVNVATATVALFAATDEGGVALACQSNSAVFHNLGGQLYYGQFDGFYAINTSTIDSTFAATLTRIPTTAPTFSGVYGGFTIDSDYIYYTERFSSRVLRNKCTNPGCAIAPQS
jgi:hypothetical protein